MLLFQRVGHSLTLIVVVVVFLVVFSDGKEAMMSGAAAFNKAASTSYANLPVEEKRRLKDIADSQAQESNMSVKDISKTGSKIFDRLRIQVQFVWV